LKVSYQGTPSGVPQERSLDAPLGAAIQQRQRLKAQSSTVVAGIAEAMP